MTQDKVKFLCQGTTPEKKRHLLRGRVKGLSVLPEGDGAVAEPQTGVTQRMRRMTKIQTEEIEKETITILFYADSIQPCKPADAVSTNSFS